MQAVPGRVERLGERVYAGRRRVATAAAAVLAVTLGYHVIFDHNGLIAYEQKRQSTSTLGSELNSLQQENEALKSHVDRLKSDPNAIEHQARQELHYTRPGEVIYTLPPEPENARPALSKPVHQGVFAAAADFLKRCFRISG